MEICALGMNQTGSWWWCDTPIYMKQSKLWGTRQGFGAKTRSPTMAAAAAIAGRFVFGWQWGPVRGMWRNSGYTGTTVPLSWMITWHRPNLPKQFKVGDKKKALVSTSCMLSYLDDRILRVELCLWTWISESQYFSSQEMLWGRVLREQGSSGLWFLKSHDSRVFWGYSLQ